MSKYYNKEGKTIGLFDWAKLLDDIDYKRVKQTTLNNGKWVSTVWLGLDHSFSNGPSLIFETMVFPKKGEWQEEDCARYTTEQEAIIGHEEMVKKWSSKDSLSFGTRK